MRSLATLLLCLIFALACGSAPSSAPQGASAADPAAATPSAPATAGYPATPAGACQHLTDCGCNDMGSVKVCEAQLELMISTVGGVMDLQDEIVKDATAGDPEAQVVTKTMEFVHGVVDKGVAVNLAAMSSMSCTDLCTMVNE